MNKPAFRLAILVLSSLLVGSPSATAATIDSATWGAVGAPIEVAAGDTGRPIIVAIRNDVQTTYSSVRASIAGSDGMLWPMAGASSASLSGNFAPGDVWSPRFYINVDPSAYVHQTSALPLTLEMYDRTNATSVAQTLYLRVQITGRVLLTVTSGSSELAAGAEQPLALTITNRGTGPASNIQVTLSTGQSLTITSADTVQNIGALAAGASTTITTRVRASSAGSPTLTAALSYLDSAGGSAQVSRTISLTVADTLAKYDAVTVRISERELSAGRLTSVTYLVWNNESTDLTNVRVKAAITGALVVPDASDDQRIDRLPTGSMTPIVVNLLSENNARGIERVPLTLSWTRADGSNASRTFNLAVPLVGTVQPSVTSVTSSVNNQTQVATIGGTLTNLGNAVALNANIQILANGIFAATEPRFIGDLSPNNAFPFTLATTSLNASTFNASGTPPFGGPGGGRGQLANGTGGQGANGTFPGGGNFPRNGTGGGGPGGFGGGQGGFRAGGGGDTVQILVTWNDEYGTTHAQTFSVQATPRTATAAARTTTSASAESSGILGVSGAEPAFLLAIVALAALGVGFVQRRR